jgi:hypothetical protein
MAMRQERQSPSQSRPLDVSFHCEGGPSLNSRLTIAYFAKPDRGSICGANGSGSESVLLIGRYSCDTSQLSKCLSRR